MSTLTLSKVIVWLRKPQYGLLSFVVSIGAIVASILSSLGGVLNLAILLFMIIIIVISILVANFVLSGIGVACLQTDPESSAEQHYHRIYPIPNGYAEFGVYLDIPQWLEEFSVEIIHDGPFRMNAWELPDPVSFNNGIIHCSGNMKKIPFILRFGGDPDEIGGATYYIRFKDRKTGRKVHSIALDGDRRVKTDSSSEDLDPEIAQELDLDS